MVWLTLVGFWIGIFAFMNVFDRLKGAEARIARLERNLVDDWIAEADKNNNNEVDE